MYQISVCFELTDELQDVKRQNWLPQKDSHEVTFPRCVLLSRSERKDISGPDIYGEKEKRPSSSCYFSQPEVNIIAPPL